MTSTSPVFIAVADHLAGLQFKLVRCSLVHRHPAVRSLKPVLFHTRAECRRSQPVISSERARSSCDYHHNLSIAHLTSINLMETGRYLLSQRPRVSLYSSERRLFAAQHRWLTELQGRLGVSVRLFENKVALWSDAADKQFTSRRGKRVFDSSMWLYSYFVVSRRLLAPVRLPHRCLGYCHANSSPLCINSATSSAMDLCSTLILSLWSARRASNEWAVLRGPTPTRRLSLVGGGQPEPSHYR